MTKVKFNIPAVRRAFKTPKDIKTGQVTVRDKTYTVTLVEKIPYGKVELISRRLLGGMLALITLGSILFLKSGRELFNKTKVIKVTAALTPVSPKPIKGNANSSPLPPHIPTNETQKPQVKISSSTEIPFDFAGLPDDVKREIALKLEGRELLQLQQTSTATKIIVQNVLENKKLELYAEIARKSQSYKDSAAYQKMEENLLADPKQLMQFLFLLNRKPANEYRAALEYFLNRFIKDTKSLNEVFLSTCTPKDADSLLQLVCESKGDHTGSEEVENLYFKFASSDTFISFAKKALMKPTTRLHKELERWLEHLQLCFDEKKPERLTNKKGLFLELIIKKENVLFNASHLFRPSQPAMLSLLEKWIPDLTLTEFAHHLKLFSERISFIDDRYIEATAAYLSRKLFQLCQGPLSDQNIRQQFTTIFKEYLHLFSYYDKEEAIDHFFRFNVTFFFDITKEQQPFIIKRLVYIMNGLGNSSIGNKTIPGINIVSLILFYNQLTERLEQERDPELEQIVKDFEESLKIALKEWTCSYRDTSFITNFEAPFAVIKKKELLEPLVEESLTLEEPLKSFNLRFIALGFEEVKLGLTTNEIEGVFARYGVEVPQEPLTKIDIIANSFPFRDFIKEVNSAKTPERLEALIRNVLNLPAEQQSVRLQAVAHGLEVDDIGSFVTCPLEKTIREKVFAKCGLNFEDFPLVTWGRFVQVEEKAFNP